MDILEYMMLGGLLDAATVAAAAYSPASNLPDNVLLVSPGPATCFTDSLGTVQAGDGELVRTIRDEKTGVIIVNQGTSSKRPTLALQGGKWVLRTDGINDVYALLASVGSRPATLLAVLTNTGGHSYFVSGAVATNALIAGFTGGLVETYLTPRISVGAYGGTGSPHLHAVTTDAAAGTATSRDGTAVATDPTGWNPFPFTTLFDDGAQAGTDAAAGDLYQLALCSSVLSAADLAAYLAYAQSQFGTP